MQRFVRKLVTQNHHHHQHHSHSVFTSLSKPKSSQLRPQPRHHIDIPTSLHRFHSCRSIFTTFRGASNSPKALLRTLLHFPTPFLLHCRSFRFNQTSDRHFRTLRSWIRRLTPNDTVVGLIIANVAVFLLWRIADEKFMINNFTISLANLKSGRLHTLITNAFSHIETGHILSNMIGLYFFGMNIGRNFGPEFLLKLYFAGAVGGSVFYLVHQAYKAQTSKHSWSSKELALGASGAVNAIMLLDIFLFPKATLYLDFFIPIPAVLLGIYLIGKDMLLVLEGNSRVSGSAHLGGAVVAAIAWAGVRKGRF